jgi:2-polyprenyl-3-methyl-5-hydroxy-6-metoxy-1,4-benzoquinol methylase
VKRDTARMMLDPLMLRLCGDVAGKRVIDVGCGEGRFSRMLAERGAASVGIDPTPGAARDRARSGRYVAGARDRRIDAAA